MPPEFKSLDNAKKCADSNAGYSVFDSNGKAVYTGKTSAKKTVTELAKEVIAGNGGAGVLCDTSAVGRSTDRAGSQDPAVNARRSSQRRDMTTPLCRRK